MPEIPENKEFTYWLFADNINPNSSIFEFVEFVPKYSTKTNKEIPVFVLLGEDKERQGEFVLSTWNIANLEELKTKLGKNTDGWGTPKMQATAKGDRINLEVVQ